MGGLANTFGGNPVGAVAALASLVLIVYELLE
jgi:4-aminobutyrate aminotransferase-like enzyme